MVVDETDLTFRCRACGREKSTKKRLVQHVNEKSDTQHRGQDPQDLIMSVYPDVLPNDPEYDTYKRISEAFRRIKKDKIEGLGPEIGDKEIQKVSELSNESIDKVTRILEDENINYTKSSGRPPTNHFEEINEQRQEVLAFYYHNPDLSYKQIAEKLNINNDTVGSAIRNKGWLVKDRYRSEKVEEWFTDNDHDSSENKEDEDNNQHEENEDIEEIMDEAKSIGVIDSGQHQDEDSELEVKYTISGYEEVFTYIESLIKSGHSEDAKKVLEELIN